MFKLYKSKTCFKKRDKYQTKPQLAPYMGRIYQKLNHQESLIGRVAGLLFGASQEAVRQLKRQCAQEEAIAAQQEQSK